MGLESGSFIDDLVVTNPVGGTDKKKFGDDHLRLIKTLLKATFPGMAGRIWRVQSKATGYTVAVTDNISIIKATAALTLALTAAATLGNGFLFILHASGGDVTIDPNSSEQINGETSIVVPEGSTVFVYCDGTEFRSFVLIEAGSGGTGGTVINETVTFNEDIFLGTNANLHGSWQYLRMSSDATIGLEHDRRHLIFLSEDNGVSRTLTLPDPATLPNKFEFTLGNVSGHDITVNAHADYPIHLPNEIVNSVTIPDDGYATFNSSGSVRVHNAPTDGPVWNTTLSVTGTPAGVIVPFTFVIGAPGEVLTADTELHTQLMPPCRFVGECHISIAGATTTGTIIVDMNAGGNSIFTNRPTIDATELDTLTAATAASYDGTDSVQTDWWRLTIDLDDDGDGTAVGPLSITGSIEMLPQ